METPPSTTDWEAKYQAQDTPWDKGEAAPGLVDWLAAHPDVAQTSKSAVSRVSKPAGDGSLRTRWNQTGAADLEIGDTAGLETCATGAVPRGTVLVPGCGLGHDVRAWAAAGFQATGFDIAPSAVERARLAGVPERVEFQLGDFLADTPRAPFDWVFEHTCFCAIPPDQREDYVRAVLRWLKPGGHYLAVNYFIPDTDGPPFGVDRAEIWARFSPHFELLAEWTPRSYPNRTGLERMFLWRRGREARIEGRS